MAEYETLLLLQDPPRPDHRLVRTLESACYSVEPIVLPEATASITPADAGGDLLLLNVDGDPSELVRRLRAQPGYAELPLLVVMETHTNRAAADFLDQGIDEIIFYPWYSEEVLARLEARLRLQRLERTSLQSQRVEAMYHTARTSIDRIEPALQTGLALLTEIAAAYTETDVSCRLELAKVRQLEQALQQVAHSIHHLQDVSRRVTPVPVELKQTSLP